MKRYRRKGAGAVLCPVNLLDVNVPLAQHGGVRPRPRPAYRQDPRISLAGVKATTKNVTKKVGTRLSSASPGPATDSCVASGSSTPGPLTPIGWPSRLTLFKLQSRHIESFTAAEIREMEMVSTMLRDFEDKRVRSPVV